MQEESENEIKKIQEWKLKRIIGILKNAKGAGTSVISLVIPHGDQICKINKMLCEEFSTASNIKSRTNRLSVLSAIVSAQQRLKLYTKIPQNGLALYCGTILDALDNKEKKIAIDIQPNKPISAFLYTCDNKFHTGPLEILIQCEEKNGFVILDGKGVLFGILIGHRKEILHRFSVELPRKHGRGGQSALRFARLRIEKRHIFLKKIGELSTQYFINDQGKIIINNLILAGSADFKNEFNKLEYFDPRLQTKVIRVLDIAYGGISGFNQAINLCSEILKNSKFIREKKIIQDFFEQITKNSNKCVFGFKETMEVIETGIVEKLLCWENLKILKVVYYDMQKKSEYIEYLDENLLSMKINSREKNNVEIKEKELFLEWVVNNRKTFGFDIFLLTDCTPEGCQFVKSFGGIGGILRYEV